MSKKKIIFILSIFLIIGITSTAQNVKAHRPILVDAWYYLEDEYLSVTFTHGVSDTEYHYVEKVEIKVNDVLVLTEYYTSQPATNMFNYEYDIEANDGDRIEVTATCSLGGSKTNPEQYAGVYWLEEKLPISSLIIPTMICAFIVLLPIILLVIIKKKERIIDVID